MAFMKHVLPKLRNPSTLRCCILDLRGVFRFDAAAPIFRAPIPSLLSQEFVRLRGRNLRPETTCFGSSHPESFDEMLAVSWELELVVDDDVDVVVEDDEDDDFTDTADNCDASSTIVGVDEVSELASSSIFNT